MRTNWICSVGLWALLVGLTAPAIADGQKPHHQGNPKDTQGGLIGDLRSAHRLLAEANHDYEGHRAQAAKEVHQAIKELKGEHHGKKGDHSKPCDHAKQCKHPSSDKESKHGKEAAVHEPQAISDAQLRQAESLLQKVQAELNTRSPKAATKVKEAIAQIETALKIR